MKIIISLSICLGLVTRKSSGFGEIFTIWEMFTVCGKIVVGSEKGLTDVQFCRVD